jgi:hypothetical protein
MQLQHFTISNVPAGLVNAPANWTPEQIAQYQAWFDGQLSGNTGERQKLLWGPEGAKYQAIKEAPLKDDFDEWRARVICFAFSLPPTAFTKQVNRATAETAQEAALEEGLAPLMFWVARLVNGIIQRRMGHPDLEFAWSDAVPVSPKEQADMVVELTGAGLQTLNEGRDVLGLGPVEGGDEIMFKTATGPVTLDSIINPPEPPPVLTPMSTPGGPAPNGAPGQNPPAEQGKRPAEQGKPPAKDGKQPPPKAKPGEKAPKPGEKPAGKPKTEVGKVADSPFGKRPKAPSGSTGRRNTALLDATRTRLRRRFETFFAERARDVAAQLARELRLDGWEALGKAASANELDERLETDQSRRSMKAGGEFNEDAHPRDEHGRWTSGGGYELTAAGQAAMDSWVHYGAGGEGKYEELKNSTEFAKDLQSMPQASGTMYRGAVMSSDEVASIKEGDVYHFTQNCSTTANEEWGERIAAGFSRQPFADLGAQYGGNHEPVILKLEGAKGADLSAALPQFYVNNPSLKEVVIPIGEKFQVASVERGVEYQYEGKQRRETMTATRITLRGMRVAQASVARRSRLSVEDQHALARIVEPDPGIQRIAPKG